MSNLIFVSLRVFISPVSIPYEQNIQGQIIWNFIVFQTDIDLL